MAEGLKLPRTTIEKCSVRGWTMETLTDAWTISTQRHAGGTIFSAARAHNGITYIHDVGGRITGYSVESDCDCEVIQLGSVEKRCTRATVEAQHARAIKELDRIEKAREYAAIDAAESAADLAEYKRQGALDRDGKPIHLPA